MGAARQAPARTAPCLRRSVTFTTLRTSGGPRRPMNVSSGSSAECSSPARPASRRKAASSSSSSASSAGRSGARPASSAALAASTSATAGGALPGAPSASACARRALQQSNEALTDYTFHIRVLDVGGRRRSRVGARRLCRARPARRQGRPAPGRRHSASQLCVSHERRRGSSTMCYNATDSAAPAAQPGTRLSTAA